MANEIQIAKKFKPLFQLLNDNVHPEVDTIILTGGRGSSKSFNVSVLSLVGIQEYNWRILYTRFTNTSITDSIKTEVSEKIPLLNYENKLIDNSYSIESKNGGSISFKGIKTSSKGQTANLKSLSGFNCFIVDEAEEIPSYETFKKVFYSIRSVDKRNLSILILNPSTKSHWIYKELFEKKDIPNGFCGVVDNVMYIHSSYLDVNPEYIPENIRRDYERLKEDNPEEYENIVLGGWKTDVEGALLPISSLMFAPIPDIDKDTVANIAISDPADLGKDKLSTIFLRIVYTEKKLRAYVIDVVHNSGIGIEANAPIIMDKIKEHKIERIFIESNGNGVALIYQLNNLNDTECRVQPYHEKMNKDAKINAFSPFVKTHFIFNEKYKENPQYKLYMEDLSAYSTEEDNKHRKDAIDVASSGAKAIKVNYSDLLFG
jgi:PBSX family phage terminase large subunit